MRAVHKLGALVARHIQRGHRPQPHGRMARKVAKVPRKCLDLRGCASLREICLSWKTSCHIVQCDV